MIGVSFILFNNQMKRFAKIYKEYCTYDNDTSDWNLFLHIHFLVLAIMQLSAPSRQILLQNLTILSCASEMVCLDIQTSTPEGLSWINALAL